MTKDRQIRNCLVFLQIATIFATGLINEIIFAALFILTILFCCITNPKAAKFGFDFSNNGILYFWLAHRILCLILGWGFDYGNLAISTLAEQSRIILCFMTYKYYQAEGGGFGKTFRKLIMLLFSFINIRSYIALLANPELARNLATGSSEALGGSSIILVGGYGYVYGLIFVVFAIIISYRHKLKDDLRVYRLILLITSIIYIIQASYTIALLLLVFGIIASLLTGKSFTRGLIIVGILALSACFFMENIVEYIHNWAVDIDNKFYIEKADELANLISGNVKDAEDAISRINRYNLSLETFLKNPIFGIGPFYSDDLRLGYHSTLIDNFARYGIFGLLSVFLIINHVKTQNRIFNCVARKHYFQIMCVTLLILSIVNTVHFAAIIVAAGVIAPEMIPQNEEVSKTTLKENHT